MMTTVQSKARIKFHIIMFIFGVTAVVLNFYSYSAFYNISQTLSLFAVIMFFTDYEHGNIFISMKKLLFLLIL